MNEKICKAFWTKLKILWTKCCLFIEQTISNNVFVLENWKLNFVNLLSSLLILNISSMHLLFFVTYRNKLFLSLAQRQNIQSTVVIFRFLSPGTQKIFLCQRRFSPKSTLFDMKTVCEFNIFLCVLNDSWVCRPPVG